MSGIHQMLFSLGGGADPATSRWILSLSSTYGANATALFITSAGKVFAIAAEATAGKTALDFMEYSALGIQQSAKNGWIGSGSYDASTPSIIAISSAGDIFQALNMSHTSLPIVANVAKYNSAGTLQTTKKLSDASESVSFSQMVIDSSDNLYAVGASPAQVANTAIIAAKYNSSLTLQWQLSLGGTSGATSIGGGYCALDASGNLIVVGTFTSTSAIFVAKYNSSGTLQWQRKLAASSGGWGSAFSVACDSSDNVYVVGSQFDAAQYYVGAVIAKLNSSGTLQWSRVVDLTGSANQGFTFYGVAADSSGNTYSVGHNFGINIIAKYNTSGTLQWTRKLLKSSVAPDLVDIKIDANNMYIAGSVIAKLNIDGSGAGTYGIYDYSNQAWTEAAAGLVESTPACTSATRTYTDGAMTALTNHTPTNTATKQVI